MSSRNNTSPRNIIREIQLIGRYTEEHYNTSPVADTIERLSRIKDLSNIAITKLAEIDGENVVKDIINDN